MNIFVCLKQVPSRDSRPRAAKDGSWIDEDGVAPEMNEPDAYALEEALRLSDAHGGEVVAVSAGPARAGAAIREALAKGAHRGLLIEDEAFARSDALVTARALAAAISREPHDLVLTGLQSDDAGFGQTGVILAEFLGLPHASIVMEASIDSGAVRVKRELESGWFQHVSLPLPALLTIQSGVNTPRYATLMGIKKARGKPLDNVTPGELGVDLAPAQTIRRLFTPESGKQTVMIEGSSPQEQAKQLLEKLRHEARVL
jgi:electron transfer flavoprotein beta subunit